MRRRRRRLLQGEGTEPCFHTVSSARGLHPDAVPNAGGAAARSESNAGELGDVKAGLAVAREEGNRSSVLLGVLQAGVEALRGVVEEKASVGAVANLSAEVRGRRRWGGCVRDDVGVAGE